MSKTAQTIQAVANEIAAAKSLHGRGEQVWISDVVAALVEQNPGLTAAEAKAEIEACQFELELARVDLVDIHNPATIAASAVKTARGTRHFVCVW